MCFFLCVFFVCLFVVVVFLFFLLLRPEILPDARAVEGNYIDRGPQQT